VIPKNTTLRSLTAGIPGRPLLALQTVLQALLHIGFGIASGEEDLTKKSDVGNCQPESVDFGEPLLVREGRYAAPELVEGRVDAEHPLPLAEVGGAPLVAGAAGRWRRGAVHFSTPRPPRRAARGRGASRGGPGGGLLCRGAAVQEEAVQLSAGICLVPEKKFGSGVFLLEAVAKFLHPLYQAEAS